MSSLKNRFVLVIASATVVLSVLFHVLHRRLAVFDDAMGHAMSNLSGTTYSETFAVWLNALLAIPIVLVVGSFMLYLKKPDHRWIPYLNTITLTFSSISLIAGGGGQMELHFSIFMVVAMLAYYENSKLVILMTIIFAIQHFGGYFLRPEIVFGTSEYPFLMVSIHALFLVLTSTATILLIHSSRKIKEGVEETERKKRIEFADQLAERVSGASKQIVRAVEELSANAGHTKASSEQIAASVEGISSGTRSQVQGCWKKA